MTQNLNMDLVDYVDELTRPHQHREPYTTKPGLTTFTQTWTTTVPPLLEQLRFASPSGAGEERGSGGYESRPAASVESISTLADIDMQAARWVRDLGQDDPAETIACVRMLPGLAANLVRCKKPMLRCCEFHELERDIRSWWAQARVITGWDSPAWRPDNTCPMCDARGTLRIKLVDQVGFCTECKDTWDPGTITHLADHIRDESAGIRAVPERVFCWCAWPRPATDAWPSLCPSCASPWCHRAGWAASLGGLEETPEHPFAQEAG